LTACGRALTNEIIESVTPDELEHDMIQINGSRTSVLGETIALSASGRDSKWRDIKFDFVTEYQRIKIDIFVKF